MPWTDVAQSVGTVIAAIVTAIALIFLLFQLRIQRRQTDLQAQSVEAARLQARQHQASMVSVHVRRKEEEDDGVWFEFEVENKSEMPCYYPFFEIFDGSNVHYRRLAELRVTRTGRVKLGNEYRIVPEDVPARHTWPYFRVTFMDNSNVFWMRDSLGRLMETSDGFPPKRKDRLTLSEFRAYCVNSELPDHPLATSELLHADEMFRIGGTVNWRDGN